MSTIVETTSAVGDGSVVVIFRPWITRNGVRIYHPEGKMWKLEIPAEKFRA